MLKYGSVLIALLTLSALFFPVCPAQAQVSPESSSVSASAEAARPGSPEAVNLGSTEAANLGSTEAAKLGSTEAAKLGSAEAPAAPSGEAVRAATTETAASPEVSAPAPASTEISTPEEGASYKGLPWGSDFNKFKAIKGFRGDLGPFSAAFMGTADDNDIALLLGTPATDRVMFEYVPQKFASVYFEPDDLYYIFYDGKFAMAFSRIMAENFDLYRDNLYKKYKKTGGISQKYQSAGGKKYKLDAIRFERGKTDAFLIKSTVEEKKKTAVSAKLVFVFDDLFSAIQNEIKDKAAKEKKSKSEKARQGLEIDLKKIE